ncbi:MAG: hypothetical protein QNL04_14475 [SAR324 cluster bacterium]|nr:hypothetical protein [SAR324 cluster bacterium]
MAVFHSLNLNEISFAKPLFQLRALSLDFEIMPAWVVKIEGEYIPLEPYVMPETQAKIPVKLLDEHSKFSDFWKELAKKRLALATLSPFELFELFGQAEALGHEPKTEDLRLLASPLKFDSGWFFTNGKREVFTRRDLLASFCEPDRLGFKELKSLAQLTAVELDAVENSCAGFSMKGKQLFSLLEMLKDVAVVSSQPLVEIVDQLKSDSFEALRVKLLKAKFPKLTVMLNQLKEAKKVMPKGVTLVMDETFEEDQFTLVLKTEDAVDLIPRLEALLELARSEKLGPLYQLL